MLSMPKYYGTEWYDKQTDTLKEEAPEEYKNEFRFYHAAHYFIPRKENGKIIAEYIDERGKAVVINERGIIIRDGIVDQTKYDEIDF